MDKGEKVLAVFGIVMTIGIVALVLSVASNNCDGTLVRGLIWLECIK
tara:strand:+ start:427 stop:567 length:141 start_codon:yes stop_codon:yes gene_type:complete